MFIKISTSSKNDSLTYQLITTKISGQNAESNLQSMLNSLKNQIGERKWKIEEGTQMSVFRQNFFPLFSYDRNSTVNHNHRKVAADT